MSHNRPTIIFVAGAWHTEFHIQPLLPCMEKLGYKTIPLALPTTGLKEPRPTFRDNVNQILNTMKFEVQTGRKVCILGHSAAGMATAQAVNEFVATTTKEEKSRLLQIIFLASFMNYARTLTIAKSWQHFDTEKQLVFAERSAEIFYSDMSEQDSKPFVDALLPVVKHDRPEKVDPAWHQIPRTFIVCTKDCAIPAEFQRMEAEEQGMDVVEFESGHCPFISQPEEFSKVLVEVVQKASASSSS